MDYKITISEHGVLVSHHVCEACGEEFTVTPAVRPEDWGGSVCLDRDCPSYDPERDADILFEGEGDDGKRILRGPKPC